MASYFSPVVDKAIEDIYYCDDNERAAAAVQALAAVSYTHLPTEEELFQKRY